MTSMDAVGLLGAMTASARRIALVLGASGGIGGAMARRLRDAGWTVRALKRGLASESEQRDGLLWLRGDALDAMDVQRAAQGCEVIVHAVNPPGYRRWSEWVLPMLDNTLAAARARGATVVLPGTVYNYGPDALPHPGEDAPQRPVTRKGAIRVEMERRLRQGAERGEFRAIVLRAGDFFGPDAANNWFSQGLVTPGKPVTRIQQPGRDGVGHQWAYLPDVAAAMAALIERRERLPAFARFHFAGHWDADGRQMAEAIRRVVRARSGVAPRIGRFPWWAVRLGAPVVPLFRELAEMRYLWRKPLRMDGARLAAELVRDGGVPHTPLDAAVERTLESLGCLPVGESTGAGADARRAFS
ncbi:NAD-dependent epimerase/dehydratase family protein [Roseateles aquatilis]